MERHFLTPVEFPEKCEEASNLSRELITSTVSFSDFDGSD